MIGRISIFNVLFFLQSVRKYNFRSAIAALVFLSVFHSGFSQENEEIVLWPNGAPGFEARKNEPSQSQDWWVKNIHNPSITVFKPSKENDKGIGILICPGGGHRALVFNSEGRDAAVFLNSLGITAFVLKYRLAREDNSPYSIEKHPKEDAQRAMRIIRSKAKEFNVNPEKLGMMGFSAGGEVVSLVTFDSTKQPPAPNHPIDNYIAKPDFIIMIYPGPIGIPDRVSSDAPPAFLVAANNDECCSGTAIDLLVNYRKAAVPVEVHIYAQGDHAFNMGKKSPFKSVKTWPLRLEDWLNENVLK